jgi:hypothetical protein
MRKTKKKNFCVVFRLSLKFKIQDSRLNLILFFLVFLFTNFYRESLFQPVFNRNKITQSPCPSGMRFSTFGHLDSSSTPSPPLPPSSSIVTHCPSHSMKQLSMPHQHSHHHHYHHLHSSTNPSISADEIDNSMGTIGTINSKEKGKKLLMKKDEAMALSRSVAGESRKSAPDVIIIAGCNTSH